MSIQQAQGNLNPYMEKAIKKYHKRAMEDEFIANITNVCVEGVSLDDYPGFADAYVASADRADGTPLTDDELEKLNSEHPEIAQSLAFESLL